MRDVIVVEGLGKRFRRSPRQRPGTLKETIIRGMGFGRSADWVWALRELSFAVRAGRTVGVIGHNGAGKTTLLRLVGGVGRPDEGRITLRGRVDALVDLGTGFHPDLSVRDNVMVAGAISGWTRREVTTRLESVLDFAELQEVVNAPLRTLSTGMQMRLAFAIAAQAVPEVLLIDESLVVGDLGYQKKCMRRLLEFKAQGSTMLFVSHDLGSIKELCDDVIWLRGGKLIAQGSATEVVDQYADEFMRETRRRTPSDAMPRRTASGAELRLNENRFGSLEMEIVGVRLLDQVGSRVATLASGDPIRIVIDFVAPQPIDSPIFSVTIRREDGVMCFDAVTGSNGVTCAAIHGDGQVSLALGRVDLNAGRYFVDVGVHERHWAYAYDFHSLAYDFFVSDGEGVKGILRPPYRWSFKEGAVLCGGAPSSGGEDTVREDG